MAKIIVGVDGSKHAQAALEWAVEEAALRDATITLVHAYVPYSADFYGFDGMQLQAIIAAAERQAEDVLSGVVAALGDRAKDVEMETEVVRGLSAPQALVERSADADLLVVGSRGRGGIAGLLLGSVSQQVAQHADCPVVIIHGN